MNLVNFIYIFWICAGGWVFKLMDRDRDNLEIVAFWRVH